MKTIEYNPYAAGPAGPAAGKVPLMIRELTIFYDAECPLCQKAKAWAQAQKPFVRLIFRPFQDPEVVCQFPDLEKYNPHQDLVVFADNGAVYRGTEAWLIVLWALPQGRPWSFRLAKPAWRPYVRGFWKWVSGNRKKFFPPTRKGNSCPGMECSTPLPPERRRHRAVDLFDF